MSDLKHFSVQVTKRVEVCVLASDESEAEDIARDADIDFDFANTEDVTAEEMYNEDDDKDCIEQFKAERTYFK